MRAVARLVTALLAGALALAPLTARAQEVPAAGNPQVPEAVGPKELQDFNLNGTVTRPADAPATTKPATQNRQPRTQAQPTPSSTATAEQAGNRAAPVAAPPPRPSRAAATTAPAPAAEPQRAAEPLRQSPSSSVTVALPKLDLGSVKTSAAAPAPAPGFAPDPAATGTLAPERNLSILPWLLAALALGAGGAVLFWRNRSRHAFAGGPQIDAFTAPEPAPKPRSAPAPRPAAKAPPPAGPEPQSGTIPGIVSTRLRPWIDIGFKPLRCVLDQERVSVDFELELFNSGSAPARAVLVEGTLFNAGPTQEGEIAAFFANPVGEGERIVVIPPLQRVAVRTQVAAPRTQLQVYELGGHQVFVPLIAFNALYGWSGGEGQTSASYLLGRDTKGEKMGPFRLDLGPRIFRAVAARLLPTRIRQ